MAAKPRFDGEWVRLGELISKAPIERCGSREYLVYSMTMRDGIVEQAGRFKKTIASKDTSSYKVVKKNQLVVGFPIDEGVIYVQNHDAPGIMSPAYNVWDFDCNRVDPAYLELALHGPRSMAYYADKMRGTTARRRTLTTDGLCNLEIPLPSIDEQIRVVHVLDGVRSLIKGANRQIAELDTLVKSRFVEMFGDSDSIEEKWVLKALIGCVDSIESGRSPKCQAIARKGKEPGVLKLSALSSGVFLPDENKAMCVGEKVVPSKEVMRGDILIARKNTPELVGACVIVRDEVSNLMFPDIVFRMHPKDDINGDYLLALLSSPSFSRKVKSLAHGSNKSMSNIPKSELASILIPVPPLSLQQEFASFVAEVDKSRFVIQQQIEKLQMLYDSLAQEYFS